MRHDRISLGVLFATGLLSMSGCEALPLAAIGSALGIATSVGGAGADVYRQGKLDSAENASLADTWQATASAAQALSLRPMQLDAKDDHELFFRLEDDRNAKLVVTLDPRTPTLTRVRIDVGVFGSEPTARLFLQQLRYFLANPGPDDDPTSPTLVDLECRHRKGA